MSDVQIESQEWCRKRYERETCLVKYDVERRTPYSRNVSVTVRVTIEWYSRESCEAWCWERDTNEWCSRIRENSDVERDTNDVWYIYVHDHKKTQNSFLKSSPPSRKNLIHEVEISGEICKYADGRKRGRLGGCVFDPDSLFLVSRRNGKSENRKAIDVSKLLTPTRFNFFIKKNR